MRDDHEVDRMTAESRPIRVKGADAGKAREGRMYSQGTLKNENAAEAQRRYCRERKILVFAPRGGICFRCGRSIYKTDAEPNGYDVSYAADKLVTSCPHCHASFLA